MSNTPPLTIAGAPVPLAGLTFGEWHFDRRARNAVVFHPYRLEVDAAEFMIRFRPIYDATTRELERDDAIVGEFQPPFPGAVGYPSLTQLFELPNASRMEMIDTYFRFDILRMYLSEQGLERRSGWDVRSVDTVMWSEELVTIEGTAVPPLAAA